MHKNIGLPKSMENPQNTSEYFLATYLVPLKWKWWWFTQVIHFNREAMDSQSNGTKRSLRIKIISMGNAEVGKVGLPFYEITLTLKNWVKMIGLLYEKHRLRSLLWQSQHFKEVLFRRLGQVIHWQCQSQSCRKEEGDANILVIPLCHYTT